MELLQVNNGKLMCGNQQILLRGFGLGGWLLPEGYMWLFYSKCDRPRHMEALIEKLCGSQYANSFWEQYYNTFITEKDIEWIASQGFNSVRLALNSRHLYKEEYLQHVDECIRWCEKHKIYIVLDMHAAPGGQTGQNIDDSKNDRPELFSKKRYQDELVELWKFLAARYKDRVAVAGYDLLNEPILKKDSKLAPKLLPLYMRISQAIREVDTKHILIWEGIHWATDFSIFSSLDPTLLPKNLMLEFHKYWNSPDVESIAPYLSVSKKLDLPLFCGETGENNKEWYTTLFPMLERHGIHWNFWTYKKMQTSNSPAVFCKPERWDELLSYLDGGIVPSEPEKIFDEFLDALSKAKYYTDVINAIDRRVPVGLPAECFEFCETMYSRDKNIVFRSSENANLFFLDGHIGSPDFRRYGGEPRPESERMALRLRRGDLVEYLVRTVGAVDICLITTGKGLVVVNGEKICLPQTPMPLCIVIKNEKLTIHCLAGDLLLERIEVFPCR